MQVEEMCDVFSQIITYEEVNAILQAIYPSVRGYSVKPTKQFCQKKRNFSQDLSRPCAKIDF